jgi:signal transduction histidine kinase
VGIAVPRGTEDVCVSIRDNGHGFSGEESERLFDPFYTTRREQGGTGLGLSLAHVIVSDHGGSFEVSGAPGEGATFTIKLPLSQHNQKDPA